MPMPGGAMTRADVSEAREQLATSPFLLVDVELAEVAPSPGQPLAHLLSLEAAELAWPGQEGESARAEFLGDSASFVVPAIEAGQVIHVHAVVTERYLVMLHRGTGRLVESLAARFPNERPPDAVAMLFLLLDEALETYRGSAVQALLDVEDLEDEMFRQRQPEQAYRLARLRRTAGLLHHTLLPYLRMMEETVTRRMLSGNFPEERQGLVREYQRTAGLVLADIESLQEGTTTYNDPWYVDKLLDDGRVDGIIAGYGSFTGVREYDDSWQCANSISLIRDWLNRSSGTHRMATSGDRLFR
ncbi:CorA family divalent cation transporter [Streptomyces yangpuensis]|uniref:CorA family divalent cation transporter n=1 Tax=Streptomyces yangpuensis TaxID=1648182 RepID=UPI001F32EAAD|nr:CorA family divalent cation transporter [Streptomyces yangpuensis]